MKTTIKDNYIQQQSKLNELFSKPVPDLCSNNRTNSQPLYQSNSTNSSSNLINSLIYVINDTYINNDVEPVVIEPAQGIDKNLYAQYALLFTNNTLLHISNKIVYNLKKYTPKALLREIDHDETVAVEKCLIVLNNLSSTYFSERWKVLSSIILHDQTKNSDTNYVYTKVIDCLLFGTKNKGPMIEILKNKFGKETYQQGVSARKFKITDEYYNAGLTTFNLSTPKLIQQRQKHTFKSLKAANNNVIASNLLELYSSIDYPNESEILERGKSLCKAKKRNKKGKIYTMRNKHTNAYWADSSKRSFIEDNIILYKYLTDNGIMIPIPGDRKSGGRVVDSFTLMPSWIRKMIKIDGEEIVEVDYTCLHPNIAMALYGGTKKYITHQYVSDETGFEKNIIKVEHLSFFNKRHTQMQRSQLYNYYMTSEPTMIKNIINEKISDGYKKTSEKLFKKEVEIMTEVIRRLNLEGIYVGYVYDALFTTKKHADRVKEVMDEVAIDLLVYTVAVM